MANYREHMTVSGMLGLGYGLGAVAVFQFNPLQGALAACLTGAAGMLPDLDSDNGRPVREMFGLLGATAPLLLVNRVVSFLQLPSEPETIMLVIVGLYFLIKYGGAELVRRLSVHRGMFHSLPALIIAAESVYLAYPGPRVDVRLLMGGGVAIGFLSHLLLDELYSVELQGSRVRLKNSSGTALKWSGEKVIPNVFSYTLMLTLTYVVLHEGGWFDQHGGVKRPESLSSDPQGTPHGAMELHEINSVDLGAPVRLRSADQPGNQPLPAETWEAQGWPVTPDPTLPWTRPPAAAERVLPEFPAR